MTKRTGEAGEKIAAKYLKKQGFKILTTNYRAMRGEIDIIARDAGTLVFVEVKTNRTGSEVPPEVRVNLTKQKQIGKIAQAYIQKTRSGSYDCRFDVVGVTLSDKGKHEISHIRDAFWLPPEL